MSIKRGKDRDWLPLDEKGGTTSWINVQVAILLDIRDELKRLNAAIYCPNFMAIPAKLSEISRNTKRKRRRK